MKNFPKVSFVICTYNGKNLVKRCLDSIISLNYPKGKTEIICVDGGSTDSTLSLLKEYKVKVINNKNQLPEGKGMGKFLGYKAAKGEYIAFIDEDNELQGRNWLKEMLIPLIEDKEIFGCACRLAVIKNDSLINQYLSLIGTDPFAAYRSLDGMLGLKTIKLDDKGDYFEYNITLKNLIITGGNCFIYRKKALDRIRGYSVDTDNIYLLAKKVIAKLAVPKNPRTWHLTTASLSEFIRKKISWSRNYSEKLQKGRKFKWIPKDFNGRARLFQNVLYNLLVLPNIFIAFKRFTESRQKAWFLHPIMAFLVTAFYGINFFLSKI